VDYNRNPVSGLFQGFTRNVGKGGMCIEIKTEKGKDELNFIPQETKLRIVINIPSSHFATTSLATVRWSKKVSEHIFDTHTIGVEYDEIESDNQKMIENYVLWLYRKPKVIFLFIVVLCIFLLALIYFSTRPLPQ
jgi:hypothetical protein